MSTESLLITAEIIWVASALLMLVPITVSKIKKQAELKYFFLGLVGTIIIRVLIYFFIPPVVLLPPIASIFLFYKFSGDENKDHSVFYGITYGIFIWLMYQAFMQIYDINFHSIGAGSERWFEFNNAHELAAKTAEAPFVYAAIMLLVLFLYGKIKMSRLSFWINYISAAGLVFIFLM